MTDKKLFKRINIAGSDVFCGHCLQPDMEVATSKLCNQFEW